MFPDPDELEAAINSVEVEPNLTVADAAAALVARADLFKPYADVEELAIASLDKREAEELADAMLPIRNPIASELRAHDVLVGVEILDHLLFHALNAGDGGFLLTSDDKNSPPR